MFTEYISKINKLLIYPRRKYILKLHFRLYYTSTTVYKQIYNMSILINQLERCCLNKEAKYDLQFHDDTKCCA